MGSNQAFPNLNVSMKGAMAVKVKKAKGYLLFSWRFCVQNDLIIVSFLALLFLFYLSSAENAFFGVKLCPDMVLPNRHVVRTLIHAWIAANASRSRMWSQMNKIVLLPSHPIWSIQQIVKRLTSLCKLLDLQNYTGVWSGLDNAIWYWLKLKSYRRNWKRRNGHFSCYRTSVENTACFLLCCQESSLLRSTVMVAHRVR